MLAHSSLYDSRGDSLGGRLGNGGQADDERRTFDAGVVVAQDLATMLPHDAIADTQAQASSLPHFLGGEERLEDAIGLGNALAIITEGDLYVGAEAGGHDLDTGGAASFPDRIVGVVHDVEKNLLQLVGVPYHLGQAFVQLLDDLDTMAVEVVGAQLHGPTQDSVELHRLALGRHLARKAQQVLHDLLGALCFLQDDAQILAGDFGHLGVFQQQVGKAKDGGEGVVDFVGYARHQLSDGRHLLGMDQLGLEHGGIGDVGHDHHDAGHDALLIPHRTEVDGELSRSTVAAHDGQVEVVDLVSGERGVQRIDEDPATGGRNQIGQRATHQFPLLVAGVVPAAVRVADQASGIDHQDQALGIVQDLLGEIAGALQFGLVTLQPGDVEHQSAILQHLSVRVRNGEGVDQDVHGTTVLAAENFLVVAQDGVLLHDFVQVLEAIRGIVELSRDVDLQQFIAVVVAKHADQSIVDLDETASGNGEEHTLLDVVEKFAITALGFAPIGDVLEHVNRMLSLAHGSLDARGGDQVHAFEHGVDVLVGAVG